MKRDITKFSFFKTFLRSINPKKYRFLVLEKLHKAFLFFLILVLISTFFTLIFNFQAFNLIDVNVEYSQMEINDVFSGSFLVNSVIRLITAKDASFFIFIFPSMIVYLFLYVFLKYLLISFFVSILFFLLSMVFKLGISYSKIFKISLFSIMIMILFDLVSVPFYSAFQIPFILYMLLFSFSLYFVTSPNA